MQIQTQIWCYCWSARGLRLDTVIQYRKRKFHRASYPLFSLKELKTFLLPNPKIQSLGFRGPPCSWFFLFSIISLQFSLQLWNMTISNFSSQHFLPREELSNSANSLSYSNDMHPDLQRGNKNHKGELHRILWTGTCLFISNVRGYEVEETVLVWSVARSVRCMLGGKWPPTTCQMLEKFRCRRFGGEPANTQGVHSLCSQTKAGETDKVSD